MEEDQEIAQSEEISNELLRQQLQNLEEELRIPYEQRIEENSIDVEVQLKKAIQELGNREQACKCMAGIALFLLNKNDQVVWENQKLNQDIDSIKNQLYEQLDMCGQEKDQLKQQIENYINKLQSEIQIENSLQRKQIKLKSTKNILKQEIEAKNQKVQELQQHFTQLKQDHDELAYQMERIKNQYYQEYSKNRKISAEEKQIIELQRQSIMLDQKNKLYQQINEDLEAKNEILWQQQKQLQKELDIQFEEKDQLLRQMQVLEKRIQEQDQKLLQKEHQIQDLVAQNNELEGELFSSKEQLNIEYGRRTSILQKLRRESGNSEQVSQYTALQSELNELQSNIQSYQRNISVNSELACIQEVEEENTTKISLTPLNQNNLSRSGMTSQGFESHSKQCPFLQIEIQDTLCVINGKILDNNDKKKLKLLKLVQRKETLFEHFHLLTQTAKMTSKYMDQICTVSTKSLFEKCQRKSIPFQNVNIQFSEMTELKENLKAFIQIGVTSHKRCKKGNLLL